MSATDKLRAQVAATEDRRGAGGTPTVLDSIEALRPHLERALPAGTVDVDRFVLEAWHAIRTNDRLPSCSWPTLAGGILTAAQLGLSLNPTLGEAWLVPRRNRRKVDGQWCDVWEANFQLGYRGVLKLARRSGTVGAVRTGIVYDWAELEEVDGTSPRLIIRPIRPRPAGAEPVAYWCVVEMLDGSSDVWAVMERPELEAIRDAIPGAERDGSAWAQHFDAMARVTVFRRLRSMLPLSAEFAHALAADGTAVRDTDLVPAARSGAMLPALGGADIPLVGDSHGPAAEGGPHDVPDGEPFPVDDVPELPADPVAPDATTATDQRGDGSSPDGPRGASSPPTEGSEPSSDDPEPSTSTRRPRR